MGILTRQESIGLGLKWQLLLCFMTKEMGDHYDDSTDLQNLIIMSNTCMSSENKISLELQVKGGELCQRTRKGPAMVFIHLILQGLESEFFFQH